MGPPSAPSARVDKFRCRTSNKEMDHDPVLDAAGQRLRSLRRQHQLSLAGLSAITGISTSTLSRLESGGRKPTLELLLALARAYQVPLDDLVGATPAGDPRVRLRAFRRHGRASSVLIVPEMRQ